MESIKQLNNDSDMIVVRSDQGDGGWSLHAPETTDEQIANGEGLLASGEADLIDGEWDRPSADDYAAASAKLVG